MGKCTSLYFNLLNMAIYNKSTVYNNAISMGYKPLLTLSRITKLSSKVFNMNRSFVLWHILRV